MNRRSFTASLAALFAAPAVPAAASLAPAAASQSAAAHFATAKLLARAHNRCSPAMLQRLLRIEPALAAELNTMLVNRGVISAAGAHGTAMALDPLNTHCITNEAMQASNLAQKLKAARGHVSRLRDALDPQTDPQANPQADPQAAVHSDQAGPASSGQ